MSDQSMAGNTGDQEMGGKADDQDMDKPSQAEGDTGDDGMSGTGSGSSTTTS